MKIKTVKINSGGAPLIINASDFNEDEHELWVAEDSTPDPVEESEETVEDPDVENDVVIKHHGGGRWTVTVNDQHVHDGFLKKAEAQALAAEY